MISLSRSVLRNWTCGASSEPNAAVAMKHFGPGLNVAVELEFEVEVVELCIVVVVVVTDEAVICTVTEAVWISGPLVPVTVRVYVPTLDPCIAETVRVDVAAAFCGGVMGLGRVNVMPLGAVLSHDTAKATGELNPSCERTVIIEFPDDP